MNTLLLFCAPIDTVLRVVDVVLGALPGLIDGPVVRSVLSSSLDTADGVVAQSGGRVRMETDQHHGFSGGWALPRSGKAGRWVVVFPDVGEGLLNMSELFGPPSGGPPPVDEPLWQAVCGGRRPTDLHVVSLGRIERKVWVAHDGDGQVFAEVVFDHSRSLGTHEVLSELIVRFDAATGDVRKRILAALLGVKVYTKLSNDPSHEQGLRGSPILNVPELSRDRIGAFLRGVASRFDEVHSGKSGRKSRREFVSSLRRFLDLIDVLDTGAFGIEWLSVEVHTRIQELAHCGQQLLHMEACVTLAEDFASPEFERWAKKERRQLSHRFGAELRSLLVEGTSVDIRMVSDLVVQVPIPDLHAALILQATSGGDSLSAFARQWKQEYRPTEKSVADNSMIARRVTLTGQILGHEDTHALSLNTSLDRLCTYNMRTAYIQERLFQNEVSGSVVFDAARAIERDSRTHRKLVRRIGKDVEYLRHLPLSVEPDLG